MPGGGLNSLGIYGAGATQTPWEFGSWHMMKVPAPVQEEAFAPGARVKFPTTTPLLSVPVVVVVPLEVPVRPSGRLVKVKMLPVVFEVTVRFRFPVTWPVVVLVVKEALPPTPLVSLSVEKHVPSLKKERAEISKGPLLVTEKVVTKLSRLAWETVPDCTVN
jgi:hypothetical protein